jgi:hypothetical protein
MADMRHEDDRYGTLFLSLALLWMLVDEIVNRVLRLPPR